MDKKEKQFQILRGLLRPALRFCLNRSFKVQEIYSAIKEEFLALASEELAQSGKAPTTSQLSIATGLQRKDVQKLLQVDNDSENRDQSLLTRIVGLWSDSRKYSTKGKAKRLSYKGNDSEFANLVHEINTDLSHHTILKELERLSIIERSASTVRLLRESVQLKGESGFSMIARDIDDLFKAGNENLASTGEPTHLHAKTTYDSIPASLVPSLNKWMFELGSAVHQKLRQRLAKAESEGLKSGARSKEHYRVSFTTFSYEEKSKGSEDVKDE